MPWFNSFFILHFLFILKLLEPHFIQRDDGMRKRRTLPSNIFKQIFIRPNSECRLFCIQIGLIEWSKQFPVRIQFLKVLNCKSYK